MMRCPCLEILWTVYGIEFLTWQYVTEEYKEGNTNLAYMIVDLDNKKFIPTVIAYQRFDEWEKNLESMKKLGDICGCHTKAY